MSSSINIFSPTFTTPEWPGIGGPKSPVIDRFVDLVDSLVINGATQNSIAYAQYYNKLANTVELAQSYFTFKASEPTGVGPGNVPTYTLACPTYSGSGVLGVGGDASVDFISKPVLLKANVYEIYQFLSPNSSMILQQNPSGSVIYFEAVITSSDGYDYSNMPFKDKLLRQGQSHWDSIVGSGNVLVNVTLRPRLTELQTGPININSSAKVGYQKRASSVYSVKPWALGLIVNHSAVKTSDHLIIRGSIIDTNRISNPAVNFSNTYLGDPWVVYGPYLDLVISISKIS